MATAVILLNAENKYDALQSVSGMLVNISNVIDTARKNNTIVIYLDTVQSNYNTVEYDKIRPMDSDTVLSLSDLEGLDKVRVMLKKKNVQRVIFVGVLIRIDTLVDITDSEDYLDGNDMRIIVCSDGITCTSNAGPNRLLSLSSFFGAEIVTCSQAQDILSSKMDANDEYAPSNADLEYQKIDPFEFQSILRGAGVFLPSDAIISVFDGAAPNNAKTLKEIDNFLSGRSKSNVANEALKAIAIDMSCVFYFWSGLFLLLSVWISDSIYITYIAGLARILGYFIPSAVSFISTPINEWKAMADSEQRIRELKISLCQKAAEYESIKVHNRTSVLVGRETKVLSENFYQLMQYIEEVIFCGERGLVSRTDMEMLLLSELGTNYTAHVLQLCMNMICKSNSNTINAYELHRFLESTDEGRSSKEVHCQRANHIISHTMLRVGYTLVMCFFVASFVNLLKWIYRECNQCVCVEVPDESECDCFKAPAFFMVSYWLYNVGTLGFSHMAYRSVKEAYEKKERARDLIVSCINYARHYDCEMEVWKSFRENNSLGKEYIAGIFESSDILLSESQKTAIIQEIDTDSDGIITKQDLETYLNADGTANSILFLSRICLGDFNFISNLTWFIGAIGYSCAAYYDGVVATVGNIV
eukprot:CAMPEP_0181091420 /NCGR_PEP_ID=MMETSP1071-20121207/8388_1 /TAXON_ID=35127 /ORGANISM="Thalassiosira sp., Strain NH16" /LENGTH=643 /DNA_ID=CAMNT_0023173557 /DNA_START=136 /DNA_END=2067 /DNA_ORIENTATION=+